MIPSFTLAASTLADSNRIDADTITLGTETLLPVYAFLPRGSMPTATGTTRGGVARIEWFLSGTSTIITGGATDTLRVRCYYGTVPGTSVGELMGATCAFVVPMDATNGFSIRLSFQTTTEASGTAANMRVAADGQCVTVPTASISVANTVFQSFQAHGNSQNGIFNSDTYLWLTLTGASGTASGTTTFVDPRTVMCIGHGLNQLALGR